MDKNSAHRSIKQSTFADVHLIRGGCRGNRLCLRCAVWREESSVDGQRIQKRCVPTEVADDDVEHEEGVFLVLPSLFLILRVCVRARERVLCVCVFIRVLCVCRILQGILDTWEIKGNSNSIVARPSQIEASSLFLSHPGILSSFVEKTSPMRLTV